MTFTGPTTLDLLTGAKRLGLPLSDADAATMEAALGKAVASMRRLDAMPDPVLDGTDTTPRLPGRAPRPEENPYGAWAWLGPLEGFGSGVLTGKSVAVKDNISVRGWPLRNGSAVFDGYVPQADATVITRILSAGGTIQGRTVCENLSFSGSSHTSWPHRVVNPHGTGRSAGGSSSGSGVVIATGEVPMALGCDQGGSIRIPAAWCGTVGLKATHGLVPYTGICALEASVDHCGPMGATVEDVARLLTAIAGPDGVDPRQPASLAIGDYLGALSGGLAGMHIAVMREGFGRPESDPESDMAVRDALARMQAAGAIIEEVSVPAHDEMFDIWNAICMEGTATALFGASTGSFAEGYAALDLLDAFAQGWRARPEAVSPTAKLGLLMGEYANRVYHGRYFAKAQALRAKVRDAYTAAFAGYDLLAMPTIPFPAAALPPADADLAQILDVALPMIGNTASLNASGHPAVTVPCAMRDGLPIGLMLVGRHFDDATVLRGAAGLEACGDWRTF